MTRETKLAFARKAAAEGIVLLKNENAVLPISKEKEIALFGVASYRSFKLGWGSGDMPSQSVVEIYDAIKSEGYRLNRDVEEHLLHFVHNTGEFGILNRYWCKWTTHFEEISIPKELIKKASANSDVAIITVGRCAGEGYDLTNTEGSYKLHEDEIKLINDVCAKFSKVVLLLNTATLLDISAIDDSKISSILYVSLGGEMQGSAVVDVISGAITPSGKLAATWAYKYEDYPTKEGVRTLEVPYNEGIYVGYRYFDTFNVSVRAPFGFGLSYTKFEISPDSTSLNGSTVTVEATVKNVGTASGKEVVQCYISAPDGKLEKASTVLAGFRKTSLITPSAEEKVSISFDLCDFASYDEERAAFVLEAGDYVIYIGNSSRDIAPVLNVHIGEEIITEKVKNRAYPKKPLKLIKKDGSLSQRSIPDGIPTAKLDTVIETKIANEPKANQLLKCREAGKCFTLADVKNGEATIEDVVAQFSNEELAAFLNGMIFKKKEGENELVTVGGAKEGRVYGEAGETRKIEKYGIPENACADGPAGLRLMNFSTAPSDDPDLTRQMVAFPCGTCFANSWNPELAREFGEKMADELKISNIDGWLAPGMNIQRNPLCGRNFEYFSEDPLISGKIAAAITNGVQTTKEGIPTGKYTTIKHYATNNIEFARRDSDSIVSERALREIYLKGFEIAVKESQPHALMTSYNMINGTYAANNYDLISGILRTEWGYKGAVMTDWDSLADPKGHQYAGNDLIMPGNFCDDVFDGLNEGSVNKADAQACAVRILSLIMKTTLLN